LNVIGSGPPARSASTNSGSHMSARRSFKIAGISGWRGRMILDEPGTLPFQPGSINGS